MELCIGIIILIIVTVGGIWIYAFFATEIARTKRTAWARTLKNASLPELENALAKLERQRNILQRERLLVSNHKRTSMDVELGECNLRIKILESLIKEQSFR